MPAFDRIRGGDLLEQRGVAAGVVRPAFRVRQPAGSNVVFATIGRSPNRSLDGLLAAAASPSIVERGAKMLARFLAGVAHELAAQGALAMHLAEQVPNL